MSILWIFYPCMGGVSCQLKRGSIFCSFCSLETIWSPASQVGHQVCWKFLQFTPGSSEPLLSTQDWLCPWVYLNCMDVQSSLWWCIEIFTSDHYTEGSRYYGPGVYEGMPWPRPPPISFWPQCRTHQLRVWPSEDKANLKYSPSLPHSPTEYTLDCSSLRTVMSEKMRLRRLGSMIWPPRYVPTCFFNSSCTSNSNNVMAFKHLFCYSDLPGLRWVSKNLFCHVF